MRINNIFLLLFIISCLFLPSCASIQNLAMNMVADVLTGEGGGDVFTSDSDPELVGDAIPFAIKLYETLLAGNPKHQGLLLMTGSLFIMYANAFVQGPAELLPSYEWKERETGLMRAKAFYLRGYDILFNGLEYKYPGFKEAAGSEETIKPYLEKLGKKDVGFLYWSVAGGLSAYSIDIMDFELNARIPQWHLMINRAYELDPDFGGASLDEFFVIFYASMPEALGGNRELAKHHFEITMEKTNWQSVGAFVSYAQSICIPEQDYDTFKEYLEKALAVDVNEDVSTRLVNIISQRKAAWLLENAWMNFSFLPMPDDY